ncbi:pyridoxal phosphate-dependent aminotransferase [Planctomonas deserti]|uniref:pyridoxal phosphate-dependent aminotransferase n=1 Tax=Planctomonas deserti TaxID=2144185 RepID=UPI000D3D18CC|nr:aminotransferase class I/II-fold pyridoxal phosphate-dependent enzyme [Planctomonas deserti]
MPELASHIASVPPSGIRRILELSFELDDVIALSVGEPDVPVAPHITRAAIDAWAADETNYGPNGGIAPLRAAIVKKLARVNGLVVDREQVWVTIGASQALYQAMSLTLGAGDEILLPDPGFPTFTMNARMLQAEPVYYPLRPEGGFLPDLDELERLITPRTRVLLINSPSNPLGTVFPREVLQSLVNLARRHDLWIISDEVYEYFTYGSAEHVSVGTLDADDRVFSVFSLSKTYALTGARVGYLVTPPGLAPIMRSAQEAAISCVNTPAQYAGVAAIEGDQTHVAEARGHYEENLRLATRMLDDRGIRYLEPLGAFYLWIDMSHATNGDVSAWAERLLLTERVAVAPGRAFGRSGEGWIRICLAADVETLRAGLSRLPVPAAVDAVAR